MYGGKTEQRRKSAKRAPLTKLPVWAPGVQPFWKSQEVSVQSRPPSHSAQGVGHLGGYTQTPISYCWGTAVWGEEALTSWSF